MDAHPFFSNRKVVFLLAIFTCLLWGSSYPAIKSGFAMLGLMPDDMAGKLVFAGWRSMLAGLVLEFVAIASGENIFRLTSRNWLEVTKLGLLQTSVMFVFFYLGLAHTTGVKSSVLNGTVSFFGVLLAHFIYRNDRLSWSKSLGCLIGFAGVLVVNFNHNLLDFHFTLIGEGAVVLSAFFMAAGMVYGKQVSQNMDSRLMTGHQLTIGGAVLLVVGYAMGGRLGNVTVESALLLGYLVLNSSFAYTLWSVLLKYNPVGMVSIFNFLVPIFGAILSAIFLGETVLEWRNMAALLLVCSGIWLVTHQRAPARA
ncbi:DMT family transporter [Propionivibrio limicola]|uniref:DMT family transporter n=1 Tax=Propionivibrio limicola TaxID=167645 RepID=UPI0012913D82|nr:DMT family transporter [Propionivibrio limicola]